MKSAIGTKPKSPAPRDTSAIRHKADLHVVRGTCFEGQSECLLVAPCGELVRMLSLSALRGTADSSDMRSMVCEWDCVDKRFGEGRSAILIQEGESLARNIDSKSATLPIQFLRVRCTSPTSKSTQSASGDITPAGSIAAWVFHRDSHIVYDVACGHLRRNFSEEVPMLKGLIGLLAFFVVAGSPLADAQESLGSEPNRLQGLDRCANWHCQGSVAADT